MIDRGVHMFLNPVLFLEELDICGENVKFHFIWAA
jgi:hypothetical protein